MMKPYLMRLAFAGSLLFTAGSVMAQHDMGGGNAAGPAASGGSTSRSTPVRRTPKRTTTVRRTTTPARRGVTAEQYNTQGDEFFRAENYDDALDAYEKAVALKPISSAYYHIGWIYNDRDEYESALDPLQKAVRLDSSDGVAYGEMGYSLYKLQRSQEAIAAYQQAVRLKTDYGTAYLGLGDTYYYQTKQYREALSAYREGVKYKSDNAQARDGEGRQREPCSLWLAGDLAEQVAPAQLMLAGREIVQRWE
jgi:tetratricopeptide (TPR) repeat protein